MLSGSPISPVRRKPRKRVRQAQVLKWVRNLPIPSAARCDEPNAFQDGTLLYDIAVEVLRPDLNNQREALEDLEKQLEEAQEAENLDQEIDNLNTLADTYYAQGMISRAVEMRCHQMKLIKDHGTTEDVGSLCSKLGDLYVEMGDAGNAVKYHETGLEIQRKLTEQEFNKIPLKALREASKNMSKDFRKKAQIHLDANPHLYKDWRKKHADIATWNPAAEMLATIDQLEVPKELGEKATPGSGMRIKDVMDLIYSRCAVVVEESWPFRTLAGILDGTQFNEEAMLSVDTLGKPVRSGKKKGPASKGVMSPQRRQARTGKLDSDSPGPASFENESISNILPPALVRREDARRDENKSTLFLTAVAPDTGLSEGEQVESTDKLSELPFSSDDDFDRLSSAGDDISASSTGTLDYLQNETQQQPVYPGMVTEREGLWLAWFLCFFAGGVSIAPPKNWKKMRQSWLVDEVPDEEEAQAKNFEADQSVELEPATASVTEEDEEDDELVVEAQRERARMRRKSEVNFLAAEEERLKLVGLGQDPSNFFLGVARLCPPGETMFPAQKVHRRETFTQKPARSDAGHHHHHGGEEAPQAVRQRQHTMNERPQPGAAGATYPLNREKKHLAAPPRPVKTKLERHLMRTVVNVGLDYGPMIISGMTPSPSEGPSPAPSRRMSEDGRGSYAHSQHGSQLPSLANSRRGSLRRSSQLSSQANSRHGSQMHSRSGSPTPSRRGSFDAAPEAPDDAADAADASPGWQHWRSSRNIAVSSRPSSTHSTRPHQGAAGRASRSPSPERSALYSPAPQSRAASPELAEEIADGRLRPLRPVPSSVDTVVPVSPVVTRVQRSPAGSEERGAGLPGRLGRRSASQSEEPADTPLFLSSSAQEDVPAAEQDGMLFLHGAALPAPGSARPLAAASPPPSLPGEPSPAGILGGGLASPALTKGISSPTPAGDSRGLGGSSAPGNEHGMEKTGLPGQDVPSGLMHPIDPAVGNISSDPAASPADQPSIADKIWRNSGVTERSSPNPSSELRAGGAVEQEPRTGAAGLPVRVDHLKHLRDGNRPGSGLSLSMRRIRDPDEPPDSPNTVTVLQISADTSRERRSSHSPTDTKIQSLQNPQPSFPSEAPLDPDLPFVRYSPESREHGNAARRASQSVTFDADSAVAPEGRRNSTSSVPKLDEAGRADALLVDLFKNDAPPTTASGESSRQTSKAGSKGSSRLQKVGSFGAVYSQSSVEAPRSPAKQSGVPGTLGASDMPMAGGETWEFFSVLTQPTQASPAVEAQQQDATKTAQSVGPWGRPRAHSPDKARGAKQAPKLAGKTKTTAQEPPAKPRHINDGQPLLLITSNQPPPNTQVQRNQRGRATAAQPPSLAPAAAATSPKELRKVQEWDWGRAADPVPRNKEAAEQLADSMMISTAPSRPRTKRQQEPRENSAVPNIRQSASPAKSNEAGEPQSRYGSAEQGPWHATPTRHGYTRKQEQDVATSPILQLHISDPSKRFRAAPDGGVADKITEENVFTWQRLDNASVASMSAFGRLIVLVAGKKAAIFMLRPFRRLVQAFCKGSTFSSAVCRVDPLFVKSVFKVKGVESSKISLDVTESKTLQNEAENFLVAGENTGAICIYSARNGSKRATLHEPVEGEGPVTALHMVGGSVLVCGGHEGGQIGVWDAFRHRPLWRSLFSPEPLKVKVLSRWLVSQAGMDSSLQIWKIDCSSGSAAGSGGEDLAIKPEVLHQNSRVTSFTCVQDPAMPAALPMVCAGSQDGTLQVWRPRAPSSKAPTAPELLFGHKGAVLSVYLPTIARLCSAAADCQVRVWDLEHGRCASVLHGHSGAVTSVWCDERHVVTASTDGSIRVWLLLSGRCVSCLECAGKFASRPAPVKDLWVFQRPMAMAAFDANGGITVWNSSSQADGASHKPSRANQPSFADASPDLRRPKLHVRRPGDLTPEPAPLSSEWIESMEMTQSASPGPQQRTKMWAGERCERVIQLHPTGRPWEKLEIEQRELVTPPPQQQRHAEGGLPVWTAKGEFLPEIHGGKFSREALRGRNVLRSAMADDFAKELEKQMKLLSRGSDNYALTRAQLEHFNARANA